MTYLLKDTKYEVHIYPVGLRKDIQFLLKTLWLRPTHFRQALRTVKMSLRWGLKRRNYWNGYLAEPTHPWKGYRGCGHGWTQRRALKSLIRKMDETDA